MTLTQGLGQRAIHPLPEGANYFSVSQLLAQTIRIIKQPDVECYNVITTDGVDLQFEYKLHQLTPTVFIRINGFIVDNVEVRNEPMKSIVSEFFNELFDAVKEANSQLETSEREYAEKFFGSKKKSNTVGAKKKSNRNSKKNSNKRSDHKSRT